MGGRVIQGYFIGGRPRLGAAGPAVAQRSAAAGAGARPAPGRPPPIHQPSGVAQAFGAAQPFGGADSFEIDPAEVGLVRSGGQALPGPVLAKMEAAFGADFSGVRVHVGPQATRIGAVAFTIGSDIYFAPGRYQSQTPQGQQLLGHELAHVIQQRQGRVRAPGSGVAVVADRALEAEADRLGTLAATHRDPVVAAPPARAAQPSMAASAIQRVKSWVATYRNSKPADAVGAVRRFPMGGVDYLEDSRQRRWYWHRFGYWVEIPLGKAPTHGRFVPDVLGLRGHRAASFASRQGSAANYSEVRLRQRRHRFIRETLPVMITVARQGKRVYREAMREATRLEGLIETDSATTYAGYFGAPIIVRGYNWCHLVGHGGGGSDLAENIVAASTHANSEQLAIERITYLYKNKPVSVSTTAVLRGGSQYLAEQIFIHVYYARRKIFTRRIDGYRRQAPTYQELIAVETQLSYAITASATRARGVRAVAVLRAGD